MLKSFVVKTSRRVEMINITGTVERALIDSGVESGMVTVFVPHTTAGVTINENADPDVVHDIVIQMNKTIPFEAGYMHGEGNSAAHIKSSLFSPSLTLIVDEGNLLLGTWQGIYFCEFDGPRTRQYHLKILKG